MTGLVVTDEDDVRILMIDRRETHNALNANLIAAIADAVSSARSNGSRAVILTGSGDKAFSAGADLQEISRLDASAAREYMQAGQENFRRIADADIPVVAAVNGLALGGGFELVLASTFAVISEKASLGLPEATLGLIPGYGGTQRLQRRVGSTVALFTMLTGRRIDAQRAYELGLSVLPPMKAEDLVPTAMQLAREVASKGPEAVASILNLVKCGSDVPVEQGLAMETDAAAKAISGEESFEGVAAFLERRTPAFISGRASSNQQ